MRFLEWVLRNELQSLRRRRDFSRFLKQSAWSPGTRDRLCIRAVGLVLSSRKLVYLWAAKTELNSAKVIEYVCVCVLTHSAEGPVPVVTFFKFPLEPG